MRQSHQPMYLPTCLFQRMQSKERAGVYFCYVTATIIKGTNGSFAPFSLSITFFFQPRSRAEPPTQTPTT